MAAQRRARRNGQRVGLCVSRGSGGRVEGAHTRPTSPRSHAEGPEHADPTPGAWVAARDGEPGAKGSITAGPAVRPGLAGWGAPCAVGGGPDCSPHEAQRTVLRPPSPQQAQVTPGQERLSSGDPLSTSELETQDGARKSFTSMSNITPWRRAGPGWNGAFPAAVVLSVQQSGGNTARGLPHVLHGGPVSFRRQSWAHRAAVGSGGCLCGWTAVIYCVRSAPPQRHADV